MNVESELAALLGEKGWISAVASADWHQVWLDNFGEMPIGIARPSSTDEVSQLIKLCMAARVQVVPQGGNTSLAGGAVLEKAGGIILSLSRMNTIGNIDKAGGTITVEAGTIRSHLHDPLEGSGLMLPMHIGAEGSAQIGGLIGTNAGGSHAFRYGMMRDLVLEMEVVLPDGTVWDGMRRFQKDDAGYQLRKLFCGTEGTLGIVTRAVLKLAPAPSTEITGLLAVPDMAAAVEVAARYKSKAGEFLSAQEFFSDSGLEMALRNIPNLSFPIQQRAQFYILVEAGAGSSQVPMEVIFSDITEDCFNMGLVVDGAIGKSKAQRDAFWHLREAQPEGQRREGTQLKHDLSVPPQYLAKFLERGLNECQTSLDGTRTNPFGHLGGGNAH